MKNFNDSIGNRTCDLPACSTVPQRTAPPRAPTVTTKAFQNTSKCKDQSIKSKIILKGELATQSSTLQGVKKCYNSMPIPKKNLYSTIPFFCFVLQRKLRHRQGMCHLKISHYYPQCWVQQVSCRVSEEVTPKKNSLQNIYRSHFYLTLHTQFNTDKVSWCRYRLRLNPLKEKNKKVL